MFIINENKNFRKNYLLTNGCGNYDENFLGYKSECGKFGFFKAVHGTKDNVEGFLKTIFDTSEDHQGIYEFIQNAVDCGASKFYMFFNENYLAVINNGDKFTEKDLNAILNVAQSGGEEEDKIGKFGIGFKLVHRMVGESNAVLEVVNDYCGPVLFSWNKINSLNSFLTMDNYEIKKENNGEWLLKILYTCFPCGLDEVIKGKNYENIVPFPKSEAVEMRRFLNENIEKYKVDISNLSEGTIFFLKLGKGKGQMLETDQKKTINGMGYTLNTVSFLNGKKLDEIRINEFSQKKEKMKAIKGNIGNIILHNKNQMNGHYSLFYYKELDKVYKFFKQDNAHKINIYNFFPIADQRCEWNFIVHSNRFQIETSRRKLLQDKINGDIFNKIFLDLRNKIKLEKNVEEYKALYTNLLLSKLDEKHDSNEDVLRFGEKLYQFMKDNIPTLGGDIVNDKNKLVIKNTNLQMNLPDLKWFYVDSEYTYDTFLKDELQKTAKKIGIKEYSLKDIIVNYNIMNYIKSLDKNQHNIYLKELNEAWRSIENNIFKNKLFKFENSEVYSIEDINRNGLLIFKDIIDSDLKEELKKIGFIFPIFQIKKYRNLEGIKISDKALQEKIKELLETHLSVEKRVTLLRFYNYMYQNLKVDFKFYLNNKNNIVSIYEILNSEIKNPFLKDFALNLKYLKLLEKYNLLKEFDNNAIQLKDVYTKIIYPNWNELLVINRDKSVDFLKSCTKFYKLDLNAKNLNLRSKELNLIDFKDRFLSASKVFINSKLQSFSKNELEVIENILEVYPCKVADISILEDEIFKDMGVRNLYYKLENLSKIDFSLNELKQFIKVTRKLNINIFKNFVVKKENDRFILLSSKDYKQIYLKNIDFINIYNRTKNNNKLILIPEELEEYFSLQNEDTELFFKELFKNYEINFFDKNIFENIQKLNDECKKSYILALQNIKIEDYKENKEYLFTLFDLVLKSGLEKKFREKLLFKQRKISYLNLPELKFSEYPELSIRLDDDMSIFLQELYDFFEKYEEIDKILNISYLGLDDLARLLDDIREKKYRTKQRYRVSNMFEFRVTLLYSLMTKRNYFDEFNGVFIYNYEKKEYSEKRTIRSVLRFINSIKENSKAYIDTVKLFYENDLIEGLNKNYVYISNENYALKDESCFISDLKELELLKKLGYKIDDGEISRERQNVLEKKSTSVSENQRVLNNSLKFYSNKSMEFSIKKDTITLVYFMELYKKINNLEGIYPVYCEDLETIRICKCPLNTTLYVVDNEENLVFKSRVKKLISNGNFVIPFEFKELINSNGKMEELVLTKEDKIQIVQKRLSEINPNENTEYKGFISHDIDEKYRIGYSAELHIYKKLLENFNTNDIIWSNEESGSLYEDSGKVDFEVIIDGERHFIEVKGTKANLGGGTNSYSLTDSQILYLKQSDKNHLIYVLDALSDKPLFIYNSFGDNFFRKIK